MRKAVLLREIDDIIEDTSEKSQKLAAEAKSTADKLAEEDRIRRIKRQIEKHT